MPGDTDAKSSSLVLEALLDKYPDRCDVNVNNLPVLKAA